MPAHACVHYEIPKQPTQCRICCSTSTQRALVGYAEAAVGRAGCRIWGCGKDAVCCWVSLDGPCGAQSQLCRCLGNKLQGVSLLEDSYRLGKESHSSASCSDKASVAVAWLPGAPARGGKVGTSVEEVSPAGRAGAAALNKWCRQSLALALPSTVAVQGGSGAPEAGCGACVGLGTQQGGRGALCPPPVGAARGAWAAAALLCPLPGQHHRGQHWGTELVAVGRKSPCLGLGRKRSRLPLKLLGSNQWLSLTSYSKATFKGSSSSIK